MFPKNTKPVLEFSTNTNQLPTILTNDSDELEDKIFFVTSSRKFLWFDEETGEHKVGKTPGGSFRDADGLNRGMFHPCY